LHQLQLALPSQPSPRIKAAAVPPDARKVV
jgi:hypothetical protein